LPSILRFFKKNVVETGFGEYEKNTICMSWQYMPQPDGRVRDERLGEEGSSRG
jgi:hypothetical protein